MTHSISQVLQNLSIGEMCNIYSTFGSAQEFNKFLDVLYTEQEINKTEPTEEKVADGENYYIKETEDFNFESILNSVIPQLDSESSYVNTLTIEQFLVSRSPEDYPGAFIFDIQYDCIKEKPIFAIVDRDAHIFTYDLDEIKTLFLAPTNAEVAPPSEAMLKASREWLDAH